MIRTAALAAFLVAPRFAAAEPIRVFADRPLARRLLAVDPDVGLATDRARADLVVADDTARGDLVFLEGTDDLFPPAEVRWVGPRDHPLARIAWRTCPRAAVAEVGRIPGARVLAQAGDRPLLVEGEHVLVWAAPLEARPNRDLATWPLLPWVVHSLVFHAADRPVGPMREWSAAPIPGRGTALWAGAILLLLWPLTLALFRIARRRPPTAPAVLAKYAAPGREKEKLWQDPSFARPLSGFFVFLAGSILLLAPYFWVATVVVPNRVQPFPQSDGLWGAVFDALQLVFFLFDFATNTAFVRFFAASRVQDPARALRYAQLFLWWQVLSGLVQVTGIAVLVLASPFSDTTYAIYAFFLLAGGAVQYPGLYGAFYHLLQGSQRFDLASTVDVLEKRIFKILAPIPFVLLLRSWGRAHPAYGEAFGSVLGLALGYAATQWLTLGAGLFFCRRAGLPIRPLFGASFGKGEVREVFTFGGKAILGQVAFRAATVVETVVLVTLLTNQTEWLGIKDLLKQRFSYLVLLAYPFFDSGVAVFGESLGAAKRALAQYFVARFLQFATLWSAIVFAILCALGPSFIRGALDPQWHRAAEFIVLAAFAEALACPGWVSDALQRGANWPLLFSAVLGGEQALRLGLFFLLIPKLHFMGLYVSVIATLSLKTVVAWWLNHRHILPLRLSPWQSLGAPLLTGVLVWAVLAAGLSWIAPSTSTGAQAVFYGGAVVAILAALFVLALVGGLDAHGLGEIDRAASMTGWLAPVSRVLAAAARTGAKLSPLHGRFPQPAAAEAMREAEDLGAGR